MRLIFHPAHALVDDGVVADVAAVGANVGELRAGGVPPEAAIAVEFFLRDELCEAVGQPGLGAGRQPPRRTAGHRRDPKLAVADEGHLRAIRAQMGVDRAVRAFHFDRFAPINAYPEAATAWDEQHLTRRLLRELVVRYTEFAQAGAFAAQFLLAGECAFLGRSRRWPGDDAPFAGRKVEPPEAANKAAFFAKEVCDP